MGRCRCLFRGLFRNYLQTYSIVKNCKDGQQSIDMMRYDYTITPSSTPLEEHTMMKTFKTSATYVACHHPKAGIIIQKARQEKGVNMRPDHPQYSAYLEAFKTALDVSEADLLCKALLG